LPRTCHGEARVADGGALVAVEVAVGAADDDPHLDHGTRLVGLALQLGDRLHGLDLAEVVVRGELVAVVVEALTQLGGREDRQHVVRSDQARDLAALGRVDRPVGRCDQGAHRHRGVGEVLVLELGRLGLELGVHVLAALLELVPQGHDGLPPGRGAFG